MVVTVVTKNAWAEMFSMSRRMDGGSYDEFWSQSGRRKARIGDEGILCACGVSTDQIGAEWHSTPVVEHFVLLLANICYTTT
jgi:hypothetical protein